MTSPGRKITEASALAGLSRAMDKEVAKRLRELLSSKEWSVRTTGSGHVLVVHTEHPEISGTLSLTPRNPKASLHRIDKLARAAKERKAR